jgi:hypothetical protein
MLTKQRASSLIPRPSYIEKHEKTRAGYEAIVVHKQWFIAQESDMRASSSGFLLAH